ncbi:MAG: hypothetical protein KDD42_06535 [Bdellovibrionales bacterium]|nr:hypothetical protein [Bdellovibrionales bacterium]
MHELTAQQSSVLEAVNHQGQLAEQAYHDDLAQFEISLEGTNSLVRAIRSLLKPRDPERFVTAAEILSECSGLPLEQLGDLLQELYQKDLLELRALPIYREDEPAMDLISNFKFRAKSSEAQG